MIQWLFHIYLQMLQWQKMLHIFFMETAWNHNSYGLFNERGNRSCDCATHHSSNPNISLSYLQRKRKKYLAAWSHLLTSVFHFFIESCWYELMMITVHDSEWKTYKCWNKIRPHLALNVIKTKQVNFNVVIFAIVVTEPCFHRQLELDPFNIRFVVHVKHYGYTESQISTTGLFYFTAAFTTQNSKSIIL